MSATRVTTLRLKQQSSSGVRPIVLDLVRLRIDCTIVLPYCLQSYSFQLSGFQVPLEFNRPVSDSDHTPDDHCYCSHCCSRASFMIVSSILCSFMPKPYMYP